jgi:hypothetical protein
MRGCLAVLLLALNLLAGCGGEDPVSPPDGSGPPNPPVYEWDPADFIHVLEVGPGWDYADPSAVPWELLEPSTLVRIHWRPEPYCTKWVLNTTATADQPLVVLGVPDAGRLPLISGENAVTRRELNYWNEDRSVIKVGGSNLPSDDVVPAHIFIQGLDVRSGRPPYGFTDDSGNAQTYRENAAAIHVEVGTHITIHGCLLHDAGNGLFVSAQATDLVVSGNHIFDNGIEGSIYEHNSYTECLGILFEANHYGPLRAGCLGNNLKDRSAGTVIRYNWIEGGNRQLDLVETDYEHILHDPGYAVTFVYGNLLLEPDGAGNSQILHYGGDGGDTAYYRRGTLYFYHNTVISTRTGNTTLLRCATNDVTVDVHHNILIATAGGDRLAITSGQGQITLAGNWLPEDWRTTHEAVLDGTVDDQGNLEGSDPGLVDLAGQDLRPGSDSPCVDATGAPAAGTASHPVDRQYLLHQATEPRPSDGTLDIGALDR